MSHDAIKLDEFVSQSGLWKVFLFEKYIHGHQCYEVRGVQPDGTHTEKVYMDARVAKTEFENLREKLEKYNRRDIES